MEVQLTFWCPKLWWSSDNWGFGSLLRRCPGRSSAKPHETVLPHVQLQPKKIYKVFNNSPSVFQVPLHHSHHMSSHVITVISYSHHSSYKVMFIHVISMFNSIWVTQCRLPAPEVAWSGRKKGPAPRQRRYRGRWKRRWRRTSARPVMDFRFRTCGLSDEEIGGIKGIYHLVMTNSSPWKIHPFLIGKPYISMGHFQ